MLRQLLYLVVCSAPKALGSALLFAAVLAVVLPETATADVVWKIAPGRTKIGFK